MKKKEHTRYSRHHDSEWVYGRYLIAVMGGAIGWWVFKNVKEITHKTEENKKCHIRWTEKNLRKS